MKRISLLLLIAVVCFVSCKKQKSNKELFEENFEVNIDACMLPLVTQGIDSTKARRICECGLKTMFEIDSTIMKKGHEELEEIFETNKDKILENCEEMREFLK